MVNQYLTQKSLVYIIISIVTLFLIIEFITIGFVKSSIEDNIFETERVTQTFIAEEAANVIKGEFSNMETVVRILSQLPEVVNGTTDECNKKINDMHKIINAKIANIFRINNDYITDCNLLTSAIGFNASNSSSIRTSLENKDGKVTFGRLLYSPVSEKYLITIYISSESENGKIVIGVLVYADQIQNRYLENVKFLNKGTTALLDDNGDIMYYTNHDLIGLNINSKEVQWVFVENKNLNNFILHLFDDKTEKSGTTEYNLGSVRNIASYSIIDISPERKMAVITTIPYEDAINEFKLNSIKGFGLFTLLYVFISILGILGIVAFYYYVTYNEKRKAHPSNNISEHKSE